MAIRLSKGFGGSPESWLIQQMQYNLWHAMQRMEALHVTPFREVIGQAHIQK
jgi:plasmid maintenance system antidote protein VapI